MEMFKKQIILGGTGGQGIILAGIVLADAAVFDERFVVQSQNYGPESRGGASRADVIISDCEIYYPKVIKADIFLALSQEAFNKYIRYLHGDSCCIVDSSIDTGDLKTFKRYNIIEYTYNVLKKPMAVNMLSLGIINGLNEAVTEDSITRSINKNVPKGTLEVNLSAYRKGYEMSKNS